ncbi:DUF3772 domain-containing protein [Pukyongiella litopenaei]|uniref:Mechanosensitive ion channel family protein n=1 Tax=Pukyongiella litopenaei TaxID=2605946 RepID=A0A2S0MQT1_9RHOB|nr:DUF3772 domain-containing protein [Pukyongiella litopenaei]AVO38196.1 mechanosensitive ion channel family protein [Pukyongiella litopenaei]
MWRVVIRLVGVALFVLLAGVVSAQDVRADKEFYEEWLALATRSEEVIDAGRASDKALDELRGEIVEYRENFVKARSQNNDRIATLDSQLAALGPVPESGEEPTEVSSLRAELTQQLDSLKVPGIIAEEAYNRANGLVSEIDRLVRQRRARQVTARSASPLNPTLWPEAFAELGKAGSGIMDETRAIRASEGGLDDLKQHFLWIAGLLLVGLLLVARGRIWAVRFGNYLRTHGGSGRGVWSFVVSLTRMIVPLAGVSAICGAAALTGLFGTKGLSLILTIPIWSAQLLYFIWLADQMFGSHSRFDFLPVPENRRREARLLVVMLAVTLILHSALRMFEQSQGIPAEIHSVLVFPLVLLASAILLRLQRVTLRPAPSDGSETEADHGAGASGLVNLVRRALVLLAVASPLVAALGYVNAAEALVFPAISTLSLMSLVLVLQRFAGDIYAWVTGQGEATQDSLFTVLIGFVLALLSLPVLALIWGARISDLTELWTRFLEGFQIGETRISPVDFLTVLVIFAIGYGMTRLVQGTLRVNLLPKTRIDPGTQNAIVSGIGYVGIFLAALIAVAGAGIDLSSLALVASALTVGIGFGLQTIVSNFVSGIILLIERPISKGDWIEVGGKMGYVRDISVRSTRIETFDRSDVIVPNSDLISGTVTNYTHGKTIGRVIVPVGVAYGTDTRKVEKILQQIANAHPMVLANPAPSVVFQGFGADALDFEIRAILRDVNWVLSVKSDMNHEIARRFVEAGIEIPFAQRDVWLRNPEALGSAAEPASTDETPPASEDTPTA